MGISELVESESPGAMWRSGRNWKSMLITAVGQQRGAVTPSDVEERLRQRAARTGR